MSKLDYKAYLRSKHWLDLRKCALRRAHNQCEACTSTERLNVHHKTYRRLEHEKLKDLRVLCKWCHLNVHEIARKISRRSSEAALHDATRLYIRRYRRAVKLKKKLLIISGVVFRIPTKV